MNATGTRRRIGGILAAALIFAASGSAAGDQIAAGPTDERKPVPEGRYEAGQWQLPAGLVELTFIVTQGPGTDIQLTFDAKQIAEEPGQPPREKRACYRAQSSTIQQVPDQWTMRLKLTPC